MADEEKNESGSSAPKRDFSQFHKIPVEDWSSYSGGSDYKSYLKKAKLEGTLRGDEKEDYDKAIQAIADTAGFSKTSPIQPTERLPKEFEGIPNNHNGTHHFLIDDFCRAYETGKLSPTNIWAVARWNIPGLTAHESALRGGITMDVEDLGNPPSDWEVLDWKTGK